MTVFEEKCLASEPFVKEHVDVNVHLPQMFTELLLNKLFVPYLFSVLVSVFFVDSLLIILSPMNKLHLVRLVVTVYNASSNNGYFTVDNVTFPSPNDHLENTSPQIILVQS